jgi:hypothetical protein
MADMGPGLRRDDENWKDVGLLLIENMDERALSVEQPCDGSCYCGGGNGVCWTGPFGVPGGGGAG